MNMFDPAPTDIAALLSPSWLSAALAALLQDDVIARVTVVETLITQATKIRFQIHCTSGAVHHLCVKGIFSATDVPTSASVIETKFYRDIAAETPVLTPHCHYARLSQSSDHGVIIMRDLITDGAQFCSALAPFTLAQCYAVLDQLAALHAAGWHGKMLQEKAAVPRFLDQIGARPIMPTQMLQKLLDDPRGDTLPSTIKRADRLEQAIGALTKFAQNTPNSLVHGDAHAGNVYVSADGVGLVDWQILQRGLWAQDVAYHIASSTIPEFRRTYERELVDYYRDALARQGGPSLAANEAWESYRIAMLYGYFLWSITRKVDPEVTHEFVHRLGTAVSDLDSFTALGC